MQTFGNCNLLCQWIPKFNYALCEKLFWGLKHLTSFCFMFLIPVLWLKQTLSAPSPCLSVPPAVVGQALSCSLPGWGLWFIPCADVIPALGAHFPSLSAPCQLKGKEQVPKEGSQGHCFLLYSVFFPFSYYFWHYWTEICSQLTTVALRSPSWVLLISHTLTCYLFLS